MAKHVPSSTDQVGTIDTTGIAPGPHSKLEGVTPIFDIDREQNRGEVQDKSLTERFAEKAVAAGTTEYQEANAQGETGEGVRVEQDHTSDVPYAQQVESPDTTGTDEISASGRDHDEVRGTVTDTLDTSDTGGEPSMDLTSPTTVEDASSLTGGSHTAEASQERAAEESDQVKALNKVKGGVPSLLRLAQQNNVTLPDGALKADIVAALVAAGVEAPADGVVPEPDEEPSTDQAADQS